MGPAPVGLKKLKFLETNQGNQAIIEATPDNRILIDQVIAESEEIEEVYFAGGEPLMMKEHYDLLQRLIDLGKVGCFCCVYNTNLSQLYLKDRSVLKLWGRFKNIIVSASIDGLDKQVEYVRKGLSWNRFVENMRTIAAELPHVKLENSAHRQCGLTS